MRSAFGPAALLLLLASPVPAQTCSIDCCRDGSVSIDEVVKMVGLALNGCNLPEASPSPTFRPDEPERPDRFTDLGNGTIRDQALRVVWEKKGRAGGLHDQDRNFTHDEAVLFLATLNREAFGGRRNWRLPTYEEVLTVISPIEHPPEEPATLYPVFTDGCSPGCAPTRCSCWPPAWLWGDGDANPYGYSAIEAYYARADTFPGSTPLRARAVAPLP